MYTYTWYVLGASETNNHVNESIEIDEKRTKNLPFIIINPHIYIVFFARIRKNNRVGVYVEIDENRKSDLLIFSINSAYTYTWIFS